ncbi:MAG: CoB--CoM heterodisulfide reductase iron-sulfur subunit B family protein [Raoultibacter sp.]|jgi:heterodisulfide reductase subunit B
MTKEFSYFPGCTACSTGLAYEMSTQYMANNIGLTLREIPDWNCCGGSSAHLINRDLGYALPARSLAISEDTYPELDILAPCAACFEHLNLSAHHVRQSKENRSRIEYLIDREYRANSRVVSLLQAIHENEDIQQAIKDKLVKSLNGLKVACYYGCLLVRPVDEANFDNAENPTSMDELMKSVGADPVDWAFKTECCGASLQVTEPSAGRPMVEKILHNAVANGAEAIVTACPMCQLNVDMREKEVNSLNNTNYQVPVYYFTELISMCLGAKPEEVGIDKHYLPASAMVQKAVDTPPPAPELDPDSKEAKIARAKAAKAAKLAKEKAEAEAQGASTESTTTEEPREAVTK